MKRKIILSLLIISTICFFQKTQSNIVRAEENNQGQVLDIDVLVEKAD